MNDEETYDPDWWQGGVCPRCGEEFDRFPALSRYDNETHVCSPCGVKEGLFQTTWKGQRPLPPLDQPVPL